MTENEKLENIEYISISDLKINQRDAKVHSEKQIKALSAWMAEVGFTDPVLIDENNEVLAGRGRIKAATEIGLVEIPCIRRTDLTAAQKEKHRFFDNRIAEYGVKWDVEELYNLVDTDGLNEMLAGLLPKDVDESLADARPKPDDIVEMVLTMPKPWYAESLKSAKAYIRRNLGEAISKDDEFCNWALFLQLYISFLRAKKKRFSVVVPLTEQLKEKFLKNPQKIVSEFQKYLWELNPDD